MGKSEQIVILDSESRHIGKECIKCQEKFVENDEIVECPRCHQLHHVDCWKAQGGCGRYGCPQIAKTVIDTSPKGDGPPPSIPRKYIYAGITVALVIILTMIFWPKPPDPAAGRTKVVALIEAGLEEVEELNRIVDQFNNTSEEIYIVLQTTSVTLLEQQLMVRAAAGDAPDIFSLPYNRYETFLNLDAFYPLGIEEEPYYGVEHPSKLRTLHIFFATKHPEESIKVLKYLVTEMPRQDLSLLKEQTGLIVPDTVLDIESFLAQ